MQSAYEGAKLAACRHHHSVLDDGVNFHSHDVAVGKLFFQTLQVLRHVGIASRHMSGDLPQAFERKVTQLNTFVKPARPTDNVRAEIANANRSWAENMGKIMMSHYDSTLASLLKATGKLALNKEDFYSAKLTASIQWGKRKF